MADFAKYLREAREAAGLNQTELAEKAGLTGSYVSILESRKKPPPSDAVLRRLAAALGTPEKELLEVAHLDRSPEDIRKRIRALDRHLRLERRLSRRLLDDFLPSSLWHFWRVRGYQEYGLEKLRLDGRKRTVLEKVLRRIGHLASRDDFLEESRAVIEALPVEERSVLAEVLPELVGTLPDEGGRGSAAAAREVPLLPAPPGARRKRATEPGAALPVPEAHCAPGAYFLRAPDREMEPRVEEGDLLLVDPGAEPRAGSLVVLVVKGGATVRQVAEGGEGLLLVALSPKVPPRQAKRSEIAGVVVEIRRRL